MSDQPAVDEPALPYIVYQLWDDKDTLMYVGQTHNPRLRMMYHSESQFWWSQVSCIKIERFDNRAAAQHREADLIEDHHPIYNRVGIPRVDWRLKRRKTPRGVGRIPEVRTDLAYTARAVIVQALKDKDIPRAGLAIYLANLEGMSQKELAASVEVPITAIHKYLDRTRFKHGRLGSGELCEMLGIKR